MPIGKYIHKLRSTPKCAFYQRIQEEAKRQGIVISEMAEDLEINPNTIIKYNAEEPVMTGVNIIKVADYLGKSTDWLLLGKES